MSGSMKALAWLIVFAGIAAAAGGLGYYKYAQIQAAIAAGASFPEAQETVAAVHPRQGSWTRTAKAVGTVVAMRQVEIRNELAGTVVEIGFSSGAIVEAGQVLVRLDARQEQANLTAAEAEAEMARLTLERRQKLKSGKVVSAQDLDTARQAFEAANARALTLQVGIDKKTIKAPFRARVGLTDLQPGAYLDAGSLIARLQGVDEDAFVDFSLPQDAAVALGAGSTVTLTDAQIPGGSAAAEIMAEDAAVDGANRTVRFRALARGLGEALRPGGFVDVVAATAPPMPSLFVPLTAVRRAPYGEMVYVLVDEDGKLRARQRIVKTGAVEGDDIAILDGLTEADLVAAAGSFKLREGLLVNVASEAPQTSEAQPTTAVE